MKKAYRFWKWAGIALAVVAAVALLSAWKQQRLQDTAEPTAATRAAERSLEQNKPPVFPAQRSPIATTVPERPPRERVGRPGEESPDDPAQRQWAQEFRGADSDGDGFLSHAEARRFPLISKEFQRMDADGDGRISLKEFILMRRWQAEERAQKPAGATDK
jgi:EF hand